MKKVKKFKVGDKVFAKLKGYPPWPAEIINDKGKKFIVKFFGTGETGYVKSEDIYPYLKYKAQYGKYAKKKEFQNAITEIEAVIEQCGGVDCTTTDEVKIESSVEKHEQPRSKRKRSSSITADTENEEPKERATVPETYSTISGDDLYNETGIDSSEVTEIDELQSSSKDEVNEANVDEKPIESTVIDEPVDICLISEEDLKCWKLYHEHVLKSPDTYKSCFLEHRDHNKNDVFMIPISENQCAGLAVHRSWPLPNFINEYEASKYDYHNATRLMLLKDEASANRFTFDKNEDEFVSNLNMPVAQVKAQIEAKVTERKRNRMHRLQEEHDLVALDLKIKKSLGLSKADTKEALDLMEKLLQLNIDEIMLKKHSHVTEMVKKLRKYVGNTEEWDLDQKHLEEFQINAENIRKKAHIIIEKFKSVVNLPEGVSNFWSGFNELVMEFNADCKHLSKRDCFLLRAEPKSRQAFMDMLETIDENHESANKGAQN